MIYFIRNESLNLVKIGTTDNVERRFRELRAQSCQRLTLVGACPGGRDEERAWHERFRACRTHGEWLIYGRPLATEVDLHLARLHFADHSDAYRPFSDEVGYSETQSLRIWDIYLLALYRAHRAGNDTLARALVGLEFDEHGTLWVDWMIPPNAVERRILAEIHAELATPTAAAQLPGHPVVHCWQLVREDSDGCGRGNDLENRPEAIAAQGIPAPGRPATKKAVGA